MNNEINKTIEEMAIELSRFFFFLILTFAFFGFILAYLFKGSILPLHCIEITKIASLCFGILLLFFLSYDYLQERQNEKK